jgi:hypothetical protein
MARNPDHFHHRGLIIKSGRRGCITTKKMTQHFALLASKQYKKNMISNKNAEKAFISVGFANWKDTSTKNRGFDKHNSSALHKEAHQRLHVIPEQCEDV